MVNELSIKDKIKEYLSENIDFSVNDFPVNTLDYVPAHPNGEILLKSLGEKTTQILDNSIDNLHRGYFILKESRWRLELINKDFNNIDTLYQMSYDIAVLLKDFFVELENYEFGNMYLVDATEPDFNEDNGYQFRTLIFALPFIEYTGE